MKKLMTLALGLAFALGTYAIAQEAPKTDDTKTEKKAPKKGKKKTAPDEEKKG
jgi:hypothetical protein